jgi:hypothetical protein
MKTRKIRIAVYMATDGRWSAAGWDAGRMGKTDLEVAEDEATTLIECSQEALTMCWVEAVVPVPVRPKPATVKGKVVK